MLRSTLLITIGALLACGGCATRARVTYQQAPPRATASQEIIVDGPPPSPFVEHVTASPGLDYIWISGAWVWRGHWVWTQGRWIRPPYPDDVWVPHRYTYRNGVHIFSSGYWTKSSQH
jgi:hypothetical protein